MTSDPVIQPERFEEILAWLDPDREVAARLYLQLREDLTNIFKWKGCSDPEWLTDETFDRVAKKVHEIRPTYRGDPRLYFRGVANNLIKENLKREKIHVSLEDVELPQPIGTQSVDEDAADIEDCLQRCLQKLSAENRELILGYYAKEKQAKIDHRDKLAQQLGTTVQTLRVKVFRIRASLQQCIERCLKAKAK